MKTISFYLILAMSMTFFLFSCNKPTPEPEPEPEPAVHTYEVSVPANGIVNARADEICIGLPSSGFYEVSVSADCDWVSVTNSPAEGIRKDMPLISVLPNKSGASRSVEISIESTGASSHTHSDKHLLVQESL